MKNYLQQKIIRKQISRRLDALIEIQKQFKGIDSWIDYVRSALGMSVVQLAGRLGLAQSSVSTSIKLEKEGRVTIEKLREVANAMDCDLVYGFVPRKKINEIVHDQAVKKTIQLMDEAETHMSLEDQKVLLDKNERMKDLVEDRLYSKHLWDN
jgi:predicted DNA-binding mobile mystery protein A